MNEAKISQTELADMENIENFVAGVTYNIGDIIKSDNGGESVEIIIDDPIKDRHFSEVNEFRTNSKEEWLSLKAQDVSSTEVSALFNMSPYLTKFELFHVKKNQQIIEIEDNDRMKWGRRLEDTIAQGFAEDYGLFIRKKDEYMRHFLVPRMSASFDYEIIGLDHNPPNYSTGLNPYRAAFLQYGPGLLEIKKVDSLIYKNNWEPTEAPPHIEFQVQQQMEVANLEWCVICPLVGGNEIKPFIRYRNKDMGASFITYILNFYDDIKANKAPSPDYAKDAEFIIELYRKAGQAVYVPEGSKQAILDQLCQQYKEAAANEANADDIKQIIKAKIFEIAGTEVGSAITPTWKINLSETKDSQGRVVTQDMVGSIINARAGYRQCRITENKGKK